MVRLKGFSSLLIAFFGGIFVAILVWFVFFRQPSGRMSIQSQVTVPQVSIPGGLGDSIRLQNNVGSAGHLKNPIEPSELVEGAVTGSQKDQPAYGPVIEPPSGDEVVNPPPAPEMIELPLESEVFEEAPETKTFENTTDMTVSEEPPVPKVGEEPPMPGVVDSPPVSLIIDILKRRET